MEPQHGVFEELLRGVWRGSGSGIRFLSGDIEHKRAGPESTSTMPESQYRSSLSRLDPTNLLSPTPLAGNLCCTRRRFRLTR